MTQRHEAMRKHGTRAKGSENNTGCGGDSLLNANGNPRRLATGAHVACGITVGLALFLITGCGLPSADVSPVKPAPKSDTVWSVVAEYIDAGRIDNTDTLILVVDRLRETDAITDLDRAKFDSAFPGVKAKRRDATSEDANTLRGLK